MPLIAQLEEISTKIDYKILDVSDEEQKEIRAFIQNIKDRYVDLLNFAKNVEP